jgi:hypothetical protein
MAVVMAVLLAGGTAHAQYRAIDRLEVDRLSDTELQIQHGACRDITDTYTIQLKPTVYPSRLVVDIKRTGFNGLDTGSPINGRWYYVYMVYDPVNDATGAVISLAQHHDNVVKPPGYTHIRKLPFAVYRKADGAFRKYRLFGWPKAYVDYVDFETAATYAPLQAGSATTPHVVWLGEFIPPGSLAANLKFYGVTLDGTAKTAYVGPAESGAFAAVAVVSPFAPYCIKSFMPMQTNPARALQYYWNAPGGALTIQVKGFFYTDPE